MTAEGGKLSGVAGRYATALFELALQEKALESVEADLKAFKAMLADSSDLTRLIKSPVFSAEDQAKALSAVFSKAGIKGLAANFFLLAAKNRRLFAAPGMIEAFEVLLSQHRGEVKADVTTAEALSASQRQALASALKSVTGKDVAMNEKVDASILGGLIVKIGSRLIDASLRTKLNSLKIAMKEVG